MWISSSNIQINCLSFLGYNLGDLSFGMDDANSAGFPNDVYLSSENQAAVQTYVCIFI